MQVNAFEPQDGWRWSWIDLSWLWRNIRWTRLGGVSSSSNMETLQSIKAPSYRNGTGIQTCSLDSVSGISSLDIIPALKLMNHFLLLALPQYAAFWPQRWNSHLTFISSFNSHLAFLPVSLLHQLSQLNEIYTSPNSCFNTQTQTCDGIKANFWQLRSKSPTS